MTTTATQGPAKVLAVSCAPQHGFAKQPHGSLTLIAGQGVQGDAHRGETVQHLYKLRKDPRQPNLCQVHLFAAEMLAELAGHGYPLGPGEIGENVLTTGLALLGLPRGTVLHIGNDAVLEITGLRTPCLQIDRYRAGLQKYLWGPRDATGKRTCRAGVMSIVRTGGKIGPGDPLRVQLPPKPHLPLRPV